jgi:hypothetical protein
MKERSMKCMLNRRAFLMTVPAAALGASNKLTSVFDGKTLNGWKPSGKAAWSVENGEIVGKQGPGAAAGDLFTEQQWSDFELECEWKMKWPGNSGIWFRYSGPKSAYQADILDEPKSYPDALSGSLYCMGKAFIAKNGDASTVKMDGWNRFVVRAIGDHLTIIQNGKEVVNVRDNTFLGPGSIGIQVHPGKQFEHMEIRVRKLRMRPL